VLNDTGVGEDRALSFVKSVEIKLDLGLKVFEMWEVVLRGTLFR